MAFIKCSGGGKLTEIIIWENTDTTKNISTKTITLPDNYTLNDFLFIGFKYTYRRNNISAGVNMIVYTTPAYLLTSTISTNACGVALYARYSNQYIRVIKDVSDTQFTISNTTQVNGTATGATDLVYPLAVYGLK